MQGKTACDMAVARVLRDAQEAEGRAVKLRPAKDSDEWLVQRTIEVQCPPIVEEHIEGRCIDMRWQIRGKDIWIELNKDNLDYCVAGIRTSPHDDEKPVAAKGSPKRKRKLKRRRSDDAEAEPQEEHDHVS